MMAAMGIRYFSGYGELAAVIEEGPSYRPDPEKHAAYQKYQQVFDDLYLQTKDLAHRL
jgi:sugar (pentulose or hexulose) kinase